MKGILLAGGKGTRLYPMTRAVSKHLLPIYDKPMFYYPLGTLMQAGVRDILLITNARDRDQFETILGSGRDLGINITYAVQPFAAGIADALRIGRSFCGGERTALILGDNLFVGASLQRSLKLAASSQDAVIFTQPVPDPGSYGIAEVDASGRVLSLEEKPQNPRSNLAVPGLYFYPPGACEYAETLKPSPRGELEITDLNRIYLEEGRLQAIPLHDVHWLDTGTCDGLLRAVNLVASLQKQGLSVGCIEEIARKMGYIGSEVLRTLADHLGETEYGERLKQLI